jgi:A/G-specific adenine glycosylase
VDSFARRLLAWFAEHGRHDLPWQLDATPYSIWVSEIMLQQTQVATVVAYFERFMRSFPTVGDLAAAELDDVLAHWSGLGYYARARNLHHAARRIVDELDGELPRSLANLMELPGIGRSTAGAILALAHGQREPILDGNVKRVLARYHGIEGWPGKSAVLAALWERAEQHTPSREVAAYTQAIMDLGATICTRGDPDCSSCPVRRGCRAARDGRQAALPSPRPRRERPQRSVRVLIVRDDAQRVLLERRPATGVWGGLFSLPEIADDQEAGSWCDAYLNARIARQRTLAPIDHAFTHFDLTIQPTLLDLDAGPTAVMDRPDWLWYKPAMKTKLGLAAPIAALLDEISAQPELNP